MINEYLEPNTLEITNLEANTNYNTLLGIKKKVTEINTLIERHAYTIMLSVEHYQQDDEELNPINNGIITPYTCRIQVREDARAYTNMATLEPILPQTPEELEALENDPDNVYMNEFQAFNLIHNTQPVILKQLKTQVIMRAQTRGQLDIPFRD